MTKSYKFENVVSGGKRYTFIVNDATSFTDAKQKAVYFILKKTGKSNSYFGDEMYYLSQNIEKGETRIVPIVKPEQLNLDLSKDIGKFDAKYEELYYGLLSEDGIDGTIENTER